MSGEQGENQTPLLVFLSRASFLEKPLTAPPGFVFITTRAMLSGVSGTGSGSSNGGRLKGRSGRVSIRFNDVSLESVDCRLEVILSTSLLAHPTSVH